VKLAVVAHRLSTRAPTGVDRYARELVRALAGHGEHQLVTVSTAEREQPDWLPAGVAARRVRGPRKLVHLGWCVCRRPRIDTAIGDAELVHVTAPAFPVPTSRPVVYTVHDLLPLTHPHWFDRVHRWGFRRAIDDARDRAAAVIADSTATARMATELAGIEAHRITVVPLGIAPPFLEHVEAADIARVATALGLTSRSYVVCVGHLNDRKNLTVIVDALAQLGDSRPQLVIAGPDGPGAARVRERVDAHGLTSSVRFTGYVPEGDLAALLAGARALLHPSRAEGFGLPPLEAMAVGTPAIVADSAALPDAVGDAALVASPDDPAAWAAAIASLDDPDIAAARARDGKAHARTLTWARTADETLAVYERVIRDRRA
jgi:glycosyltransferase involved in cell wall biosynthesis